jgi:hypothetical protein
MERVPIPWWRIATVAVLAAALAIAVSQGHNWDAGVIALLLIPGIALVGLALYFRWKAGRRGTSD